jgi:hypothetical protein
VGGKGASPEAPLYCWFSWANSHATCVFAEADAKMGLDTQEKRTSGDNAFLGGRKKVELSDCNADLAFVKREMGKVTRVEDPQTTEKS